MKTTAGHQSSVTRTADPPPIPKVLSKEDNDMLLKLQRNVFRPRLFGFDDDFLTKGRNYNAGRLEFKMGRTVNANVLKLDVNAQHMTPIVNDPYVQGKIFIATLLSPMYALGVTDPVEQLTLVLHISPEMNANVKTKQLLKFLQNGVEDGKDAKVKLFSSGFEVLKALKPSSSPALPMLAISGSLSTFIDRQHMSLTSNSVEVGDLLVVTKAVGRLVALKAFEWLGDKERRKRMMMIVNELEIRKAYHYAIESLSRSNRTAAQLMRKYGAHGAVCIQTDGLNVCAQDLVRSQKTELNLTIYNLPVMGIVSKLVGSFPTEFNLRKEVNRDHPGGLLIAMSRKSASEFIKELQRIEGQEAWVIGEFSSGPSGVNFIKQLNIIEVNL